MRLSSSVRFGWLLNQICLPPSFAYFKPGLRCTVTGWGHTSWNGTMSHVLREGWIDLVSKPVCNSERSVVSSTYSLQAVTLCRYHYSVTLIFKSVDEILQCDHSNKTPLTEILDSVIYFLGFYKKNWRLIFFFGVKFFVCPLLGVKGEKVK